jgi:7-carboxy-7-deazaguanine synthase
MQLNTQTPELPVRGDGRLLAVHSIFYTIQGEGPFTGEPAVFVRLAGCNLQCPMCDTEYTEGREVLDVQTVCDRVQAALLNPEVRAHLRPPCGLVVITGGEPMRQHLGMLTHRLTDTYGFRVQIETNGSLFAADVNYVDPRVTVVCSPKMHVVHRLLEPHIAAFKYVATRDSLNPVDGLPDVALGLKLAHTLYRPPNTFPRERIFLQPVDEQDAQRNADNLTAVVESCLKHGYRLCMQTHKIIGVP